MKNERSAGVLLHITSLPGKYGIGTLGKSAYEFVDWLKASNLGVWQVLPLVPTNYGDSPYQSVSSTALNYYLIDFDILNSKKLLLKKEYEKVNFSYDNRHVNYSLMFENKCKVLYKAYERFDKTDKSFIRFIKKNEYADFALYMTIKELNGHKPWNLWEEKYQNYSDDLRQEVTKEYFDKYMFWLWTQYEFLSEWNELKKYANKNKIKIVGDMPLYVSYDSVEVWKYPEMFQLNKDKSLKLVAGCPPDCFTEDGQLWGNPVYDWKYMKETNYKWWNERLARAFKLYDCVRIDHFRGFDRYYAIEANMPNARIGEWLDGPKFDLFKDKLDMNIIAEDLGFIDDGVRLLMKQTNYPGMKILEFAFDGCKDNEHKPSNYTPNYVAYTGTHDNMPLYQYISDLDEEHLKTYINDLENECKLLGVKVHGTNPKDLNQTVIELAFASVANMCIIPMQDLLNEDESSRMNLPATVSTNNWSYRVLKRQISKSLSEMLSCYTKKYKR